MGDKNAMGKLHQPENDNRCWNFKIRGTDSLSTAFNHLMQLVGVVQRLHCEVKVCRVMRDSAFPKIYSNAAQRNEIITLFEATMNDVGESDETERKNCRNLGVSLLVPFSFVQFSQPTHRNRAWCASARARWIDPAKCNAEKDKGGSTS